MSIFRAIVLASLAIPTQQPSPPSSAPAPEATAPQVHAQVHAYGGSLAQGLAEIEAFANKDKTDEALRVADELLAPNSFLRWKARASEEGGWKKTLLAAADPLLDRFGWNGAEPSQRAAVHYAKGVVLSRAGRRAESESAFETARSLAGPGDLRLDAIYDLGTSRLMEGEAQRAQLPEISGKPAAAPPVSAGASGGVPGAPPAPDPLELAKAAYLRARDHFSERLQADWHDADTRANVELVAKRLKELDAIQKKREEEKKKQQEQQKQDSKDKQSKDDKSKDSKDKDREKQDAKDKPDPDKDKPDEKKNDTQDQKKPDEKKQDDKQQPQDQKNAENDKDKSEQDAQAGEKEQKLTKEEVIRMFDRLNQIEEKARQMQAQIRRARNAKVKKDW